MLIGASYCHLDFSMHLLASYSLLAFRDSFHRLANSLFHKNRLGRASQSTETMGKAAEK